jgi:hypothetical protein
VKGDNCVCESDRNHDRRRGPGPLEEVLRRRPWLHDRPGPPPTSCRSTSVSDRRRWVSTSGRLRPRTPACRPRAPAPGCVFPLHRRLERGRRRSCWESGGGRWRHREGGGCGPVGWVLRVLQRPGRLPLEGRIRVVAGRILVNPDGLSRRISGHGYQKPLDAYRDRRNAHGFGGVLPG